MKQTREEVRLKLVLMRGTELARLYHKPEVSEQCLQRYRALVAEYPALAPALTNYQEMLGDSYRVLRSGASYAATEYQSLDEYIETVKERVNLSAPADERAMEGIAKACSVLDPYIEKQQAILDRMTAHAEERGLIKAVADMELHYEVIRAEFPDRKDYLEHVPSLFDADMKATLEAAATVSADSEALRLALLADKLAARTAVEYELKRSCNKIYPDEASGG